MNLYNTLQYLYYIGYGTYFRIMGNKDIRGTPPQTNSSPLKIGGLPQKKIHLTTIDFQGPC